MMSNPLIAAFSEVSASPQNLKPALKYLRERGLTADICKSDEQPLSHIHFSKSGDVATILFKKADRWVFEFTGALVPGPDKNNFRVAYRNLDDALLAVWAFYFGKPAIINGWMIPFHRYPDWNFARLQYRLANCATISQASFTALREKRQEDIRGEGRGFNAVAFQLSSFIKISQDEQNDIVLWLRRDLGEGYVVT
jgi:hypothetical protein